MPSLKLSFPFVSRWMLLLFVGVLMAPVLSVVSAWLPMGEGADAAMAILREMASTVLPDYVGTTLLLCGLVTLGVALVGLSTAGNIDGVAGAIPGLLRRPQTRLDTEAQEQTSQVIDEAA